jgi:hypothetical protein
MNGRGIRASRVTLFAALTVLALAVPAGVLATKHFGRPTHIHINTFTITDSNGVPSVVSPGATVTHCASVTENTIEADGTVQRTIEGKNHKIIWTVNGARENVQVLEWTKTKKRKRHYFQGLRSTVAEGLADGLWALKVTQGGKQISAPASVTIAEDVAC